MASPRENITSTLAANIRPRIHRPMRICARPGTSHPPEQIARVNAMFIGLDSTGADSNVDPYCSFDWSISGLYGRVSFRGHCFPSLQSQKSCVYSFLLEQVRRQI